MPTIKFVEDFLCFAKNINILAESFSPHLEILINPFLISSIYNFPNLFGAQTLLLLSFFYVLQFGLYYLISSIFNLLLMMLNFLILKLKHSITFEINPLCECSS